ncbi:MAG: 4Fe-4S binding protein [Chloroflexi bacterium]|nr:4Fe-4S binding protein [Chloroflexota bacterium]
MRRILLVLAALTITAVFVPPPVALADSQVKLQVRVEPAYPLAGQEVRLAVLAMDKQQRRLGKAQVVATAWMDPRDNPGMPEMPAVGANRTVPVRVTAVPQKGSGEYLVASALPMAGRWRVQVWVRSPGATGKTDLELDVISQPPPRGMNWPVVGAFLASVAATFTTVLLLKRGTRVLSSRESVDLLRSIWVSRFLRSRWYPAVFQIPVALFFLLILYFLLAGSTSAHDNLGSSLVWVIWWPLLPLIFLFLGRFWCAVCPMSGFSDLVQRFLGQRRPVPAWLKRWGVWIVVSAFLLITWLDAVSGLVESPARSALLLIVVIAGVLYCGILYERRAWCRHLCFIGGMSSNYAMTSILELRADGETCRKCRTFDCVRGNDRTGGCPMFVFPKTMDSNRHCNLCGNCIKSCQHQALRLRARFPGEEMWNLRQRNWEEALFAALLLGLVAVQTVVMLEAWTGFEASLRRLGIDSYPLIFTLAMLGALATWIAALAAASVVSARFSGVRFSSDMTRYAYALIPLGLAVHLAHNLNHLLGEALSVLKAGLSLAGQSLSLHPALFGNATIQALQFIVIAIGTLLAVVVVLWLAPRDATVQPAATRLRRLRAVSLRRIAPALPHLALVLGTSLVFFWIFSQSMVPRMQMSAEAHDDITLAQIERARASVRQFVGRNLDLSYVHLEEHGYRDIILKSGYDYYFVDAENYLVVSMFSEKEPPTSSFRIGKVEAEAIALNFALRHYPSFYSNQLETERGPEESSPFIGGFVFKWRQHLDGVPTPNAVKIILDRQGRVAIYSARDVQVTVPTDPKIDRERALQIAMAAVEYAPAKESISLDIGPELTGRQMLRWTVVLEGQAEGTAASQGRRNSEITVDALTGEVTSIVDWG